MSCEVTVTRDLITHCYVENNNLGLFIESSYNKYSATFLTYSNLKVTIYLLEMLREAMSFPSLLIGLFWRLGIFFVTPLGMFGFMIFGLASKIHDSYILSASRKVVTSFLKFYTDIPTQLSFRNWLHLRQIMLCLIELPCI